MLKLKNVKKRYKSKIIFDNVNLEILNNGVYLIKGDNGCGKTTLLNVIGGFTNYKGKVINKNRRKMSYLFQSLQLVEYLTIEEHFKMFDINISILSVFELMDKIKSYPNELSSGEKQRIGLLLALYSKSKLILLDEPFANLNKENILIAMELIKERKKEAIILIVSHDNELLTDLDGILSLKNGKIKGLKNQKLENNDIKDRFFNHKKVNCGLRYYKKTYFKLYSFIFCVSLLIFSFSFSKNVFYKIIDNDIRNSVDYNKFYLKECKRIDNNLSVSKCVNPSIDKLINKKIEYKYNYDYLLNFFYNRDDVVIMDNSNLELKEGEYPDSVNEVLASDKYNIGDIITLNSNQVIRDKKTDVYTDTFVLKVSGIYKKLNFYNDEKIYIDYKCLEDYFKEKKLINNNISVYEYYKELKIDNYKYLSFSRTNETDILFEGEKFEYYNNIIVIIDKISELLNQIWIFVSCFLIYCLYKILRFLFVSKQKSMVYMVANSFSKVNIIFKEVWLNSWIFLLIFIIGGIFSLFGFKDYVVFKRLMSFFISFFCINVVLICLFFSRNKVEKLLREEVW